LVNYENTNWANAADAYGSNLMDNTGGAGENQVSIYIYKFKPPPWMQFRLQYASGTGSAIITLVGKVA